jgi:hypothetical protein
MSAEATRTNRVSGSPVNGSFPPGFDGAVDGGELSNVMPSTVGDTEELVVRPPGGGLVGLPLAGHALLLGLVVGNAVLVVNGTTKRLGCAESGLALANGMPRRLGDGLPSAFALATRTTDAPTATVALSANAVIPGSLNCARVTQVTAHNLDEHCEEAGQASRSVALAASS